MEFPKEPKEPLTVDPKFLIMFSLPKIGKTTALSLLKDNLIIDLQNGSDHVGGLTIKANSFAELKDIKAEMSKQNIRYDYLTFDTTTDLEEYAIEYAKILYQATPMGAGWGKVNPKTGKVKPGQESIIMLPNGAGYYYIREAFQKIVNGFKQFVNKCLILSGHVNEKLINKDGEEISEMQLDLTGKLSRIMCSKADAIGLVFREENKVYINFDGGGDCIVEARAEHIAGQKILLTEKIDGKIVAYWDRIFLELNK